MPRHLPGYSSGSCLCDGRMSSYGLSRWSVWQAPQFCRTHIKISAPIALAWYCNQPACVAGAAVLQDPHQDLCAHQLLQPCGGLSSSGLQVRVSLEAFHLWQGRSTGARWTCCCQGKDRGCHCHASCRSIRAALQPPQLHSHRLGQPSGSRRQADPACCCIEGHT